MHGEEGLTQAVSEQHTVTGGGAWAYREDAARGTVRSGPPCLVSPHDVAGAAQPVQGDRCVLEVVDELDGLHEEGCEYEEGAGEEGAGEGPGGYVAPSPAAPESHRGTDHRTA